MKKALISTPAVGVLLCCFAFAPPALAEEGAAGQAKPAEEVAPAEPAKPVEVPETTEVQGKVPDDLGGRWFTVSHVKLPSGHVTSVGRMWEIRRGPDHLELVLRRVQMPEDLTLKLQQASADGKLWDASAEELKALRDNWDKLTPGQGQYESIENKLFGSDAYPKEFTVDETSKGSNFAIVVREGYAGSQALHSTYSVYAVRDRQPDRLLGTFVMSSIAAAPLPIPITLKGDFVSYRLSGGDAGGGGSLLERIFGMFSGCGR
jgi:hypothetical protein